MCEEEVKVEEEVKKVIHSVTSDAVKNQGVARRNSTGKANSKTSPSLLSSDEKNPHHYLQDSTSSCHDFCKYGRKHNFEAKKRIPNFRRFSDSSKIHDREQKEVSTLQGRRKRSEIKMKSTKPEQIKLSATNAVTEFVPPETLKLETPFPSQRQIQSLEFSLSVESEVPSETTRNESSSPTEKRVFSHEPTTPFSLSEKSSDGFESIELESSSSINRPEDQVIGLSEELTAPSPTEKSLKAGVLPPNRRSTASAEVRAYEKDLSMKLKTQGGNSINKLKIVEGRKREMKTNSPPSRTEISYKTKAIKEKKSELTKQKDVDQKKVIKPVSGQKVLSTTKRIDTPVMKSSPILISANRVSALRNIGNKLMKNADLSKPRKFPVVKSSRASVSKKIEAEVKEKTHYVTEPRTLKTGSLKKKELKKVRSQPSPSSPKCEEKRILSKTTTATISSDIKSPSPNTLKFQRGKLISPMSENNSPRTLKFRQAKGILLKNEAGRRSFRRRRGSFGSASELSTPRLKAPTVVLRHQDVQEKKEAHGLFNHVIEETANKLVETKKSKVKALVGAFETVISLQES